MFISSFCFSFWPQIPSWNSNKAVLLTDAKINLGWGKYFYSTGILKIFEIPTKTSESFLYPPTYFVQSEILKFLPIICSFLHSPLNNEKGQLTVFVLYVQLDFINRSMYTHTSKHTYTRVTFILFQIKPWNYAYRKFTTFSYLLQIL